MTGTENTERIRVWDPIVRIGHWVLVVAFFTAYFTEDDFLTQHTWAGYTVGAYILIRLIWGFIGPRYARFKNFVCSPAATLRYIGELIAGRSRRHIGHNPAGAAMVVALLFSLTTVVGSGLMLYAVEEDAGPLASWVGANSFAPVWPSIIADANADDDDHWEYDEEHGDDGEEFWEEIHELFSDLTLFLVALHVGGVLFSSHVHRENLIRAMLTGRKRRNPGSDAAESGRESALGRPS